MLKTKTIDARTLARGACISPIAFGYGEAPVLVLEFYDEDGRRNLVKLSDAQVAQIARGALRGYGRFTPDSPKVFDIEATRS